MAMLAACASESVNTSSADYSAGYSDGCSSGSMADSYSRKRVVRDASAYKNSADYKSGWHTGYNACVVRSGRDTLGRDGF